MASSASSLESSFAPATQNRHPCLRLKAAFFASLIEVSGSLKRPYRQLNHLDFCAWIYPQSLRLQFETSVRGLPQHSLDLLPLDLPAGDTHSSSLRRIESPSCARNPAGPTRIKAVSNSQSKISNGPFPGHAGRTSHLINSTTSQASRGNASPAKAKSIQGRISPLVMGNCMSFMTLIGQVHRSN